MVEWFGRHYITELQKANSRKRLDLLACAKHFPGHGDTDQDSHTVLPVISADRPRLNSLDLPPFREAVKDGVGMIMVAHLLVPALDPEKPTTFSKKTITALLREGMEFDGLIVSDALDMGALAQKYPQDEIAVRTVESGMDILLHPVDARVTINAVAAAVEQGRLTLRRIQESVERIREAKMKLGLFEPARGARPEDRLRKHRAIAQELGRKALKIVSGNKKLLPFTPDQAPVSCSMTTQPGGERCSSGPCRRRSGLSPARCSRRTPNLPGNMPRSGWLPRAGWYFPSFRRSRRSRAARASPRSCRKPPTSIIAAAKKAKKPSRRHILRQPLYPRTVQGRRCLHRRV